MPDRDSLTPEGAIRRVTFDPPVSDRYTGRVRKTFRALQAGALACAGLALVGSVAGLLGCLTPAERRALSVADCVAQRALALPDRELPANPWEVTSEDLALAIQVVDGVRACRRAAADPPDGG